MKILIGDDHVLFREGLRRLLEQLRDNATFAEASNFDELLDMAASKDEAYDLVLTDLRMPGWPGFSGIGMLRERQPNAKVVVVSASEAQADVREALENGAAGYIPKSSSAKVLLGALQLVLAGGIYLPEQAIRGGDRVDQMHGGHGGNGSGDTMDESTALGSGNGDQLTPRQRDVLARLRDGKSNKQIAHELGLTEGTVKVHVTAILRHLGVRNRTQAALTAQSL